MSRKTVAMRTESCFNWLDCIESLSAGLAATPQQERRGAGGHQKDAVNRRHPEILEPQAGEDLDRDDEIPQGRDEGQAGARCQGRTEQGEDDAREPPPAVRAEGGRGLFERWIETAQTGERTAA